MFWLRWTLVCLVAAGVLVSVRPLGATEAQSKEVGTDLGAPEAAAASATARGNRVPLRIEARAKRRGEWYGYQTLAVDAAAAASIFVAAKTAGGEVDAGWLILPGIAGYLFGAPIVHWTHGGHATLASFALRLGPPVIIAAGALVCYPSISAASTAEYISPFAILGVVVGCSTVLAGFAAFPAVVILDAVVLARERVEPPTQSLVLPSYDPTRRAGMLTWAGTF